MTETVTVTPVRQWDSDGNPIGGGGPVELTPLEVAPGNTVLQYGVGGDLDDVEFTVFLPLRVRTGVDTWTETAALVPDDSTVTVRGKKCRARTQVWQSQRSHRGGVAVLCRSTTGLS